MKKKNYLVTGANGYIGSEVVKKLVETSAFVYAVVRKSSQRLSGIDHRNIKIIECLNEDINSLDNVINDEIECFVHTAWAGNSGAERQNFILQNANVIATFNAYKTSEKLHCKKFLSLGTISEKVAETIEFNKAVKSQNLFYGYAKYSARLACEIASRQMQTKFIWAMLSNVYGKNNETGNIISYTLTNILDNRQALFSSAAQIYDLIYLDDCVSLITMLAQNNPIDNTYFLGSGRPRKLKEYLYEIGEIAGKSDYIKIGARENDNIAFKKEWFSVDKLKKEFGYVGGIDFKTGVEKTLREIANEYKF